MNTQRSHIKRMGIDLLGSDFPPQHLLKIILDYVPLIPPHTHLILLGTPDLFEGVSLPEAIEAYPVAQAIEMSDPPLTAIRTKKNSSLCTGIQLLKEKYIQAFISAGNTGALMGYAKLQLKSLPHVERPALLTLLPTKNKDLAVIDVGANTRCKPSHLIQFAMMGIAYQRSRGIATPKVGLLNIGSEACKGTPELQDTYNHLLTLAQNPHAPFIFSGNIEGRDAFLGNIDVLVTDGFTGNIFLKTAEGIAAEILEQFEAIALDLSSPALATPLKKMRARLHYAEHPGALLCGVDGIVIKCHGQISPHSLQASMTTALHLLENAFLAQIKSSLNSII